jgi:hypothetical protein
MSEQENPPIQITAADIREANQLSLHCPICASPVEKHPEDAALVAVICGNCKTLYHKACWEQGGGSCAVLGCDHEEYILFGRDMRPAFTLTHADLPEPGANGRRPGVSRQTKELKRDQQRQVEELRHPSLLRRLWQWLLDQIRIGLETDEE